MIKLRKIGTAMIAAIVLAFLLFGQMTLQIYATATPTTVSTKMHFDDSIWVQSLTLKIQMNFTIQRTDTLQCGIQFTQLNASGWIEVNGEKIEFRFHTTKYPTWKIYSAFNEEERTSSTPIETLSSSPVRYEWDGLTFISIDSTPLHVEYDHDDNGPYSPPTYEIPPNEASPTTLQGDHKYHHHIPKWTIEDMIAGGTLTSLAGAIGAFIALLLAIPEAISKIVAVFVSVVAGILAILGLIVRAFTESVLRTELGDGWTWIWGLSLWWRWLSWYQSFGRWRDWGFYFVLPLWNNPGSFSSARLEMGRMTMTLCAW